MAKNKPYKRAYVEITNLCNLSCSFCHGTKRAPRDMTVKEFRALLPKLRDLTDYVYFHLMGEPTLHPNLIEFISLSRSFGLNPMITTNGTLLEAIGDEIIEAGIYKVNVSLHSFEKNSKIEMCNYIKSCANFARRAASCGVIVTLRLWNGGAGIDNSGVLYTLKESFPGEWRENNRGMTLSPLVFLEYQDRFGWPDIDGEELGSSVYCHGLSDHFGVLSDGTVVPCCLDGDGAIALGNAFSGELCEILNSERANNIKMGFRNRRAKESLCQRCPYARRF